MVTATARDFITEQHPQDPAKLAGLQNTEIGPIPSDWQLVSVGSLFSFKNGLNKSKEYFGHGRPIVNYMDVFSKPGIRAADIAGLVDLSRKEIERFGVRKGDVFFTRTSETLEDIGIASVLLEDIKDAVFSGFVLRGRPTSHGLTDSFKKYCFSSSVVRHQIVSKGTYTTRALTNGRALSSVLLPIPPTKSEQQAIGEALGDTDACIESLSKLIEKKRLIKQGAMHELLSGRRRLPGFSGEWAHARLGQLAEIGTGSRNNQDKEENGLYPFFVRSKNVERINSYSFDCEAILVPGEGGIGDILHYIDGKFDVHQRVYAIRNFTSCSCGKYIYYYMMMYFGAHAKQNTVKATVDSLRLPTFQNFAVMLPPTIDEQASIAALVADFDTEIDDLELKLAKARQIKQGMMQVLLTGRVRLV